MGPSRLANEFVTAQVSSTLRLVSVARVLVGVPRGLSDCKVALVRDDRVVLLGTPCRPR